MASEQRWHRWYCTGRWQKRRRYQLQLQPLCEFCLARGKVVAATVVDHVEPHHGDHLAFWTGKVQSLCAMCHSGAKATIEKRGYDRAIGPDGWPLDPRHPCYRADRSA
jgi:hypothetical protein